MARIPSFAAFLDPANGYAPKPAEERLIAACRAGRDCDLGPLPDTPAPDRIIRADLLRLLIIGGTAECGLHDSGVSLKGAWIEDALDLRFATAKGKTNLLHCHFVEKPDLTRSRLNELELSGSKFEKGLWAQGIFVSSTLFARNVKSRGRIVIRLANIRGQLAFDDANLHHGNADDGKGEALQATSILVESDIFFDCLSTIGLVDLRGATINGRFVCDGANLNGCGKAALDATRLEVKQGFIWRGLKPVKGRVDLTAAHVGDLVDDAASWPQDPDMLVLDGFTYDRIVGAPTDATMRLDWLRRGSRFKGTFAPQPYVHLAKVLRQMGHEAGARSVLVALGTLSRAEARKAAMGPQAGQVSGVMWLLNPFRWFWDQLEWAVIGYGHRPGRAVIALLILWSAATYLAGRAWDEGSFAPNSAVVLTSPGWTGLLAVDCIGDMPDPLPPGVTACDPNPADTWSARAAAGMDWDSFSPAGYGIDLVVPILNLGQTDAWAPSRDRGPMGWWLWWGRWVLIGAGWLVSALGVAAITGIMQRNQPTAP